MFMRRHPDDLLATDAPAGQVREVYIALAETADGGEEMMAIREPGRGEWVPLVCTCATLAGVSALVEAARVLAAESGRTARVVRFTAREEFVSFGPEPGGGPT